MPAWCLILVLAACAACSPAHEPKSRTLVAQQGLISSALSPDGKYLFTSSFQHGGALWDQKSGARLFNWNLEVGKFSAYIGSDFSEDGWFLATTDGETATIWSTRNGEVILNLQSPAQNLAIQNTIAIWASEDADAYWRKPGRIVDIALSQQYLLLGLENQVAILVDITQQSVIGTLLHEDAVTGIAMNDAATVAVTGARSGEAYLWDLTNGQPILELQRDTAISFVEISPTGHYAIIGAYQGAVLLVDAKRKSTILFEQNPGITSARFNQNETQLLVGTARERVYLIDLLNIENPKTWQLPKAGPWHGAAVIDVAFSEGGYQAIGSDGFAYRL